MLKHLFTTTLSIIICISAKAQQQSVNHLLVTDVLTAQSLGITTHTLSNITSSEFPSGARYFVRQSRIPNGYSDVFSILSADYSTLVPLSSVGIVRSLSVEYYDHQSALDVYSLNSYTDVKSQMIKNPNVFSLSANNTPYNFTNDSFVLPGFTHEANGGVSYIKSLSITWQVPGYERNVTENTYGTICMPYAVKQDARWNATFYNIAGTIKDGETVVGIVLEEETGDLVAGKPYLFRGEATDKMQCRYHGEVVSEAASATGLVGNINSENTPVPVGSYILKNNELKLVQTGTTGVTVGANRAYINLAAVPEYHPTGNAAIRWRFDGTIEEDEATSITSPDAHTQVQTTLPVSITTLSGVVVPELRQGINIVRMSDGSTRKVVR